MQRVEVYRFPIDSPGDTSRLTGAIDEGRMRAQDIICILGKTEGNGCVNDFTRGFATLAYKLALAERLGIPRDEVERRVAFIMSGGTEGVITPHITVFVVRQVDAAGPPGEKRLAAGVAFTRDFLPEEIGTMAQVHEVARATNQALQAASIDVPADVHFVQIKCPLLTAERMEAARRRGRGVATTDTYKSMGYSRGASALGVALALGEITGDRFSDAVICKDWSLYSRVASASAGVELNRCEIILLGNSTHSASDLVIGHDVMDDAIDAEAVRRALRSAGIAPEKPEELSRVVNVFAKAEASSTGLIRGRRHVMLEDSDINHTRHSRAVVNAVIASVVGDPMLYVSGGAEHQGPDGGGPIAVVATLRAPSTLS